MEVLTGALLLIYLILTITLLFTVIDLNFFIGWMYAIVHFRQKWLGERIIFDVRRLSMREPLTNPQFDSESTEVESEDTSEQD